MMRAEEATPPAGCHAEFVPVKLPGVAPCPDSRHNHLVMDFTASALDRRSFLLGSAAVGAGLLTASPLLAGEVAAKPDYRGPNVILIRWGGGARRRESIDPKHTYAPVVLEKLEKVPVGGPQGSKPQTPVVLESVKIVAKDSLK